MRESEEPCNICLSAEPCEFSCLMMDVGVHSMHCGCATHGLVVLGGTRKQINKQQSSLTAAFAPASRFLPYRSLCPDFLG